MKKAPVKRKNTKKKQLPKWLPIAVFVIIVGGVGAYLIASSQAATKTCKQQVFKVGSSGPCVSDIQGLLNYSLFGKNTSRYLKVDGKFGTKTRDYVKVAQAKYKIRPTDGVVGPNTWHYVLCFPYPEPTPKSQRPAFVNLYGLHARCGA